MFSYPKELLIAIMKVIWSSSISNAKRVFNLFSSRFFISQTLLSMSITCCHVVLQRMSRGSLDEHSVRQHRGRLLQLAESTGSVSSKRRSYSSQHALFKSLQQMTPSPRLATKLLSLEEVRICFIVLHQFKIFKSYPLSIFLLFPAVIICYQQTKFEQQNHKLMIDNAYCCATLDL